jgi:hypothetical protein
MTTVSEVVDELVGENSGVADLQEDDGQGDEEGFR